MIVDAFAALRRPDATLVICGTGSERDPLERRAVACGAAPRVRFEGHVSRERVGDYFAAADVFVHAAELEAAGNVVLEALAAGAVAIVTDSGGPGEYVQDGVNGFVIPVGDTGSLTARLETVLSNPALRDTLAASRTPGRRTAPRLSADDRRPSRHLRRGAATRHALEPPVCSTPGVATSSR